MPGATSGWPIAPRKTASLRPQQVEPALGNDLAGCEIAVAAPVERLDVGREALDRRDGLEHLDGLGGHFGAGAVSGNRGDLERAARPWRRSSPRCRAVSQCCRVFSDAESIATGIDSASGRHGPGLRRIFATAGRRPRRLTGASCAVQLLLKSSCLPDFSPSGFFTNRCRQASQRSNRMRAGGRFGDDPGVVAVVELLEQILHLFEMVALVTEIVAVVDSRRRRPRRPERPRS